MFRAPNAVARGPFRYILVFRTPPHRCNFFKAPCPSPLSAITFVGRGLAERLTRHALGIPSYRSREVKKGGGSGCDPSKALRPCPMSTSRQRSSLSCQSRAGTANPWLATESNHGLTWTSSPSYRATQCQAFWLFPIKPSSRVRSSRLRIKSRLLPRPPCWTRLPLLADRGPLSPPPLMSPEGG